MSGFVGILNLDGAPVDRDLLWRMTRHMTPRGPDAQEIWIGGNVGFGHTLLRTTWEAEHERQPLTLDGQVWITADCRVDARPDLIRELAGHGCAVRQDAPDPELILHAYAVWGEACVDHLLGDFSFAIWDGRRRTLFCARDHFGVKPFLYAHVGQTLIFSNTLNAIRLHPAASNRLDELAIADFLIFGSPQELDGTSFSDVRRLPPAHALTAGGGRPHVMRYWELPEEDELRYRRRGEYVEHFLALFDIATRDRLRTDQVGVLMSGGLDSPTVAATAHRILSARGAPFDLRAHSVFYGRLVPDEERKYSRIAADGIGIPIHQYPLDDYRFPPEKSGTACYPPEPGSVFDGPNTIEVHRAPVAASRVLLSGYGADPLIDLMPPLVTLIQRYPRRHFLSDLAWLTWTRRQVPRIGMRSQLLKWLLPPPLRKRISPTVAETVRPYPEWLQPDLVRRLDLVERWRVRSKTTADYLARPCELLDPFWPYFLEYCDPGIMGLAGEMRHPFLDLRFARFARRLPRFPWFAEKALLRVAMKGILPRAILSRPKTPLAGNPFALLLPPAQTSWWEQYLSPAFGLESFLDTAMLRTTLERVVAAAQAVNNHADIDVLRQTIWSVGLNIWLGSTAAHIAEPD